MFFFLIFSVDLDLTNNSLTSVPILNNLNESLQSLSLKRNQICTIDETILNSYDKLQTIELNQNPLHCDCRLDGIVKKLIESKKTLNGLCQSPIEQRNKPLNSLIHGNLSCSLLTLPQCTYLIKTKKDISTTTVTTTTTTTTMTTDTST